MKYLTGEEEKQARKFIDRAVKVARQATCQQTKCGSIIVKDGQIIGRGFNSPPDNQEDQRRCADDKENYHPKVTDKTCCVHAEQRAIMDALQKNPDKLPGSRLYFIRLDNQNDLTRAGQPYCTICSKMALDVGISEFVLWHQDGVAVYPTAEYNQLSFQYRG